ncbi:hypothetical protein BK004_04015 [bacterium CG10_46_32]|nr:MAG: hypothetical protein BK004_04015 [bacterium CG10_46_32]PIR55784.1 MAG: hypothetical protein COU73_04055 [Parcubacteria group bacterium CG10_big_fil_rev_8_21_14_0_10_46_32]
MRIKKKEKIIVFFGTLGVLVLLFAIGFSVYQKLQPDIVVDPNITDEYRQELEVELADARGKSLENPQDIDARILIGILEQKLGRLSASERAFKNALKINDQHYLPYLYLGSVYEAMGQYQKADDSLRVSTQLNPQDARPFQILITLYKQHFPGEADELNNIFRAASDYTNSPEIWEEYAQFLEDRREYRQAWVYWKEVLFVEHDNTNAAAHVKWLGDQLGVGE